jgi:nitrogen-specific signal transduction histidine kinase
VRELKNAVNYACAVSAGPVIDITDLPLLLPEVSEAEHAQLADALQRGEEREFFNMTMRVRERTTLHNLRTLPVLDRGQHIGSILLMEDITDDDRMQRKVLLTEKLAAVGLLAAGVAHEINNPLSPTRTASSGKRST